MTTPPRRTFNHGLLGTLAAYGLIETLFQNDAFAESVKPVIKKWMGELNALRTRPNRFNCAIGRCSSRADAPTPAANTPIVSPGFSHTAR